MSNKKSQYQKICLKCVNTFDNERLRDIFTRRYGLNNGESETLESIGDSYDITRERVRQIEEAGLKSLRGNSQIIALLKPIFADVRDHISNYGNVIAENKLFGDFTDHENAHPESAGLYFILTIDDKNFHRFNETDEYRSHWTINRSLLRKFTDFIQDVIGAIEESGAPADYHEFVDNLEKEHKLNRDIIENYLMISKNVGKNIFGEVGLNSWPEIKPRGVRDKMIVLCRREKKPLHFHKITDLINDKFDDRTAYPQTVHNELIKDDRFVLVGRGTYALKEWGYEAGTVKDIIRKVLESENGSMPKKMLVEKVLAQRLVSPATIVINLKSREFVRLDDGSYILKK